MEHVVDEYEVELLRVARKGLDAVNRFLEADAHENPGLFQQLHLRAKVGSKVVADHVRYMSAVNNRTLLQMQFGGARAEALLGPGNGVDP